MKNNRKQIQEDNWRDDLGTALSKLGFRDLNDFEALSRIEGAGGPPLHEFCVAILALRRTHSREVIEYILQLFGRHDKTVLLAAANALSGIRSRAATRPLLRVVRISNDTDQRLAAIHALGYLHDARAADLLMHLALDKTEPAAIRDYSVEALSSIPSKRPRIIRALLAALKDESVEVRWCAAWALGRSDEPRVVPFLQSLLEDEEAPPGDTMVKEAAREAIEEIEASARYRRRSVANPVS